MAHLNPVVSIRDLSCEPFEQGHGYASADADIAELTGLTQIGASYREVPPGKSACPLHAHRVEEELFIILEGSGEYQFGEATYQISPGDVLCAPRGGREFAHKITNTGTSLLTYLAVSNKADTDICEYPDSDKFMVRRRGDFRFVGRSEDEKGYWDGEPGG